MIAAHARAGTLVDRSRNADAIGKVTHESVQRQAGMATRNLLNFFQGKPAEAQANQAPWPSAQTANQANVANRDSWVNEDSIKAIDAMGKISSTDANKSRNGISHVAVITEKSGDNMMPNT